jgi:hypothetical protein
MAYHDDYNNAAVWTVDEALAEHLTAYDAFGLWDLTRSQNIAQDYLVSLLIRPRGLSRAMTGSERDNEAHAVYSCPLR